ncbi:MAG TPA: hypothetical protein VFY14_12150, partial [Streptomyces sp.]|nr:hypothetical protein [Streptomyces sp.]
AAPPAGAVEWLSGHVMPDGSPKEIDADVALDRFREHRARAEKVDEILKHVSYLKSQSYARERDRAAMRVAVLRDVVSSMSERAVRIMDAQRSGDFEGTSDIHAVQEQLRRSESELAQAVEDLREAEVQAAVAASTVQRAAADIAKLRADREDMRQRGWTLPELPERVARVLEEGVFEKWLSEED